MKTILKKLWTDPDYFRKSTVVFLGLLVTILPLVPIDNIPTVGYWISKFALPIIYALGATVKGSGLTPDEAAKLRALIPSQEILDTHAPKV